MRGGGGGGGVFGGGGGGGGGGGQVLGLGQNPRINDIHIRRPNEAQS